MGKLKSQGKSFEISKREVWEAFRQVKANQGAAGVDGQSVAGFEADLKNNLFKIWNRMSSGSYFPPPVKGVEIPKPHGGGIRLLGVPTVADRVAQTVVAMHLEERAEPRFHPDSYGYRPRKAAWDAVGACRNDIKLGGDRHQPEYDLGQRGQPGSLAGFAGLVAAAGAFGFPLVAATRPPGDEVAVEGDLEGQVGGEVSEAVRGKSFRSR